MEKVYSYEEAFEESLKYFNNNELSAKVFLDKYALRNNNDELVEKSPDDMHLRISKELARIENKYENPLSENDIFNLIKNFKFIIPQGSPMAGIGNPYKLMSLSNCIVIEGAEDSYGGILYTDQEQAQLMKRRCGVGHDISKLRPKGLPTKNAARTTDGIAVFMERFSNTTREVAQNGRRGALMLTISVHHPEILTFIKSKQDLTKVTGANISVRLTDEFMNAVKEDKQYELRWPVDSDIPEISEKISAKEIWDEIINAAWSTAEPGLLFWDNIIKNSPADSYSSVGFQTKSTNPCAELPLSPYDSCRLLLLNTTSYISDPFTEKAKFDFDLFKKHVKIAQRLMDDIIDLEIECIDKIIKKINSDPENKEIKSIELNLWKKLKKNCENGRRTGLGITGLGDTLAALNITYGSDESVSKTEEIYKTLALGSYESSIDMAKERGAFPVWEYEKEKDNQFVNRIFENLSNSYKSNYKKYGRRNIANLTTAPCGSVSMISQLCDSRMFNITSGTECAFLILYTRRKKIVGEDTKADFVDSLGDKWKEFTVYHSGFELWKKITGKGDSDIEDSPYFKATSNDIDWEKSVDIQSAAQKWVDHAISKTCNLPNNTTKELVAKVYLSAWEKGLKGFTVYRDGCRSGVLVSNTQDNKIHQNDAAKRPKELECDVYHISRNKQPYIILVGLLDGKPYEVFAISNNNDTVDNKVKKGKIIKLKRSKYRAEFEDDTELSPISAFTDNQEDIITRLVSTSLRHNTPIEFIQHQLEKTKGDLNSLARCISRALKNYIADGTEIKGEECPDCGSKLIRAEGCRKCSQCQYSVC